MANIAQYLQNIATAIYGKDVRSSIHDAIDIINKVGEKQLTAGSDITAGDPKGSYYENSLYINTTTNELLRCGSSTWAKVGNIKGEDGNGIASITGPVTIGLIDTYTITYDDGSTKTFDVTNGNGIASITGPVTVDLVDTYTIVYDNGETKTFDVTNGENGNKWYRSTSISGKSVNPTVFSDSGIVNANVGDLNLNVTEGSIYHCETGGAASVATWVYDFTLTGGGSGGASTWGDVTGKPFGTVDTTGGLTLTGSDPENKVLGVDMTGKIDKPGSGVSSGKVLTSDGNGGATWEPPVSGASSLSQLTDVNTSGLTNKSFMKYNSTTSKWEMDNQAASNIESIPNKISKPAAGVASGKVLTSDGDGDATWEDPQGGGHTLDTSVATVEGTTSENQHVPSSYVLKQYANRYTDCVEAVLTANTNTITIPSSGNEPIFENDDATFEFMFEPNGTDTYPITLKSYEITTTTGSGKVVLTFEKAPTVNTNIRIDVTTYRD